MKTVKPRKPIARISAKRRAKLGSFLTSTIQRVTPIRRGGKPKTRNAKRRATEFARAYGSKARVAFVQQLGCCVPGCGHRPAENAHIVGGGMGRKANADKIIPLCGSDRLLLGFPLSHHRLLHSIGAESFQKYAGVDLEREAARTEAAWQAFSGGDATIEQQGASDLAESVLPLGAGR